MVVNVSRIIRVLRNVKAISIKVDVTFLRPNLAQTIKKFKDKDKRYSEYQLFE